MMDAALLMLALGFAALGWLLHLRIQASGRRACAWPTTSGRVVSSAVRKGTSAVGAPLTPVVVYSYEIGGVSYEGAAIRIGSPPSFHSPTKALAAAARYPAGSRVTVHYDPAAPATAALDLAIGEGRLPFLAYAAAALTFLFLAARLLAGAPS
jgi:hypothetical protein